MLTPHFELTHESRLAPTGEPVFRIRAIRDIPERFVKAGDLGGWVSSVYTSTSKLRIGPHAWVAGDAVVAGDATIADNALVYDRAAIFGNAHIGGYARVHGRARVSGDAVVKDRARVNESAHIRDQAAIRENAAVSGHSRVLESAQVAGNARVEGNSYLSGHAQVAGDAYLDDTIVSDEARVDGRTLFRDGCAIDNAHVTGSAVLFKTTVSEEAVITAGPLTECYVEGKAKVAAGVPDNADLSGDTEILSPHHCEVFQPLGVPDCPITVTRTAAGEPLVYFAPLNPEIETIDDLDKYLDSQGLAAPFRQSLSLAKQRVMREIPAAEEDTSLCFELTDIAKTLDDGTTVYRIRAVRDIEQWCVSAGDLGGWVPSTHTPEGTPRIGPDSWLADDAMILGSAYITNKSIALDNACIKDHAVVQDSGRAIGTVTLSDETCVKGGTVLGDGELTGRSYVGNEAGIEVAGTIPDAWINSTTDHRRFGPTSTDTMIYLTRQRDNKAQILVTKGGVWDEGSLDEFVPANPVAAQFNERDWWHSFGTHGLLAEQSPQLQHLVMEEYAQLRKLITIVLKQWDA
ncbi:MAG: hypothetical protein Q4D85_11060 [Corynebacterium sp.]|uniref:hypothetical protein n=1 Tax=Corynebacterium sp. TaxID=1720 RepID=UPI0026DC7838|nr:hypothetical protein [Corynebacterium sp.]MDO5099273.1 hypothetical protein [Corynebacterium sp.]